ncbi:MAG: tyrosine-type recombinase/integrase [Cetobacterium sp.]
MSRFTVYNKGLYTEDKWMGVNPNNKQLITEYLDYLGSLGRSKETISQYHNDLRIFFCYYLEFGGNKHFTELKKIEVVRFQGWMLKSCGMSSSRIRRMRSTLSSLSNFIEAVLDEEYPNFRSIINRIEAPPKVAVREKTIVTFEECEKVANVLVEKGKYQLACFLMVACYSGLRKQELTRLKFSDFHPNPNMSLGGSFYKTSPIKVKGRGNLLEPKYVWDKVDKWLKLWIQQREELNIVCDYLFCRGNIDGYSKIEVATANSFAKSLSKEFDGGLLNLHCLRHALATELTRAGLPIDVIQFLLGHKSSETSKLYIDISDDENMEKYHGFFKDGEVPTKGLGDLK